MPRANRGPYLERNKAGVYEIRWTEAGRSRRESTRTSDAAAAADAFRVWKQGVEREAAAESVATVRGLLAAYWSEHVEPNCAAKDGSLKSSRSALLAHFADLHPAEIAPRDVREFVRKRKAGEIGGRSKAGVARGVQNPTIRRDLTLLVAALNHSVAQHRMKASEVPHIDLPPENGPRVRWLTDAELARLFAAAAEISAEKGRVSRIERWLHIAYYTARRKAAVEGLAWDRIDFELNTADFDVPGRRRTKKRRGVAYLHPRLRTVLERARAEREAGDNGQPSPWVLDHPGDIRAAFRVLRSRAGLGPDVTIHTLKHSSITHMLRRGVSIWDVAGATETSPETIRKVYGKHVPEAMKAALTALA